MSISRLGLVMLSLATLVVAGCSRQTAQQETVGVDGADVVATKGGGPVSIEHCTG